jgi:signal transduction histidine kinase
VPLKLSDHDKIDWPWYVPVGSAVIPIAIGVEALLHRKALWPPRTETLLIFVALLPWILDAVDQAVPFRIGLPEWVFVPVVVAPTTILLFQPTDFDFLPFLFVFLAGEMGARLRPIASLVVAGTPSLVMIGFDVANLFEGSFIWVVGILFGWCAGLAMRQQMLLTTRMKAEQETLAEKSASEERQRIAREIHDVIAHSMSVTMLHITAARMALERDRSADALDALREAEQQGRNSLNEIRRTVGLLGPDEAATAPPMPTASDLPKLVADFRNAGLDVTMSTNGDLERVPAASGVNLYRIVQESLTNVAKHAPGAKATVDLQIDGRDIRLRVHNNNGNGSRAERSASGLGLKGMAGRAAIMGGSLDAGPSTDGWTVTLTAPT